MNGRCLFWMSWWLVVIVLPGPGCRHKTAQTEDSLPPMVAVSRPIEREVSDYVDFTGRTEAPQSVDVRPRVTGYLVRMPFKEGAEVKTGDLLFEIDPRPYQALLDKAKGDVMMAEARLKQTIADYQRALATNRITPHAVSQQDLDKYLANQDEAEGSVQASKAQVETCKINLDFTRVTSPIDGRISRYLLTIGNLANQDATLLTTVVSQDPMYAYFDVDEQTLLRVARILQKAKENLLDKKEVRVWMGLADEQGFPHEGYVDFANNVVDPSTGTVTSRGVFANPAAPSGSRLLRPGMFVRVRLHLGKPFKAVLVAERALATDQGKKYLLVVDEKNVVQYRQVAVGPLQDDGLRVISEGLEPHERVITSGLQLVQPRMEVRTEEVPMPTTAAAEPAAQKPPAGN